MKITSNFLKANTVTPSGIYYTEECLKKMCNQIQDIIDKNGVALGEIKHEINQCYPVELKNVTHLIENVYYDKVKGISIDVKFTKDYLEYFKDKLAITPRGTASYKIDESGNKIIDQMDIVSFDLTRKID